MQDENIVKEVNKIVNSPKSFLHNLKIEDKDWDIFVEALVPAMQEANIEQDIIEYQVNEVLNIFFKNQCLPIMGIFEYFATNFDSKSMSFFKIEKILKIREFFQEKKIRYYHINDLKQYKTEIENIFFQSGVPIMFEQENQYSYEDFLLKIKKIKIFLETKKISYPEIDFIDAVLNNNFQQYKESLFRSFKINENISLKYHKKEVFVYDFVNSNFKQKNYIFNSINSIEEFKLNFFLNKEERYDVNLKNQNLMLKYLFENLDKDLNKDNIKDFFQYLKVSALSVNNLSRAHQLALLKCLNKSIEFGIDIEKDFLDLIRNRNLLYEFSNNKIKSAKDSVKFGYSKKEDLIEYQNLYKKTEQTIVDEILKNEHMAKKILLLHPVLAKYYKKTLEKIYDKNIKDILFFINSQSIKNKKYLNNFEKQLFEIFEHFTNHRVGFLSKDLFPVYKDLINFYKNKPASIVNDQLEIHNVNDTLSFPMIYERVNKIISKGLFPSFEEIENIEQLEFFIDNYQANFLESYKHKISLNAIKDVNGVYDILKKNPNHSLIDFFYNTYYQNSMKFTKLYLSTLPFEANGYQDNINYFTKSCPHIAKILLQAGVQKNCIDFLNLFIENKNMDIVTSITKEKIQVQIEKNNNTVSIKTIDIMAEKQKVLEEMKKEKKKFKI